MQNETQNKINENDELPKPIIETERNEVQENKEENDKRESCNENRQNTTANNNHSDENEKPALRVLKKIGKGIYNVLYATGGFFSELFGITTPRYAYALREYERMQRLEREREMEANGENEKDLEQPDVEDIKEENA